MSHTPMVRAASMATPTRTMIRRTAGLGLLLLTRLATGAAPPDAAPTALPDGSQVRSVLEQSPMILSAHEFVDQGKALQRKWSAGPHEWEVTAYARRRTDPMNVPYREQEYELTRTWRLPGKGSLDRQIGAQSAAVGEFAFEDGWHEAGRTLLAGWFTWLRAERATRLRTELSALQRSALDSVAARVRAGDAPDLELRLAQTEMQRTEVERLQSAQEAQLARDRLLKDFPALTLAVPLQLPEPQALTEPDAEWMARIEQSNHEIKLADGRAAAAELEARRARLDRLPDPTIGVVYSPNFDQNRQTVGVRVSVPLSGSLRSAEASLAASHARAAAAEATAARLRVSADGREDLANRHAYYEQWQNLAGAASDARRNADAYARGYRAGEFGLADLLNAQRLAAQAALSGEEAQLRALEADARLRVDAHRLWAADND